MLDTLEVASIVDAARSETKRWGGAEPTLTHLAVVLARRWSPDFREVFGEDGPAAVEGLLRDSRFRGDETAVREVCANADNRKSLLDTLHAKLSPDLATDSAAEPATGLVGEPAPPESRAEEQPATGDAGWPQRTAAMVRRIRARDDVRLREREVEDLAAYVTVRDGGVVALVGDPGVGTTALVEALAARLERLEPSLPVWQLGPDSVTGSPAQCLRMVLEDIEAPTVLVVDGADSLSRLGTVGPDHEFVDVLRTARFHAHARLVVVISARYLTRLEVVAQELTEDLLRVPVGELVEDVLADVVRAEADRVAEHHGVSVSPEVIAASLARPRSTDRRVHPGLALTRIDIACARAALAGSVTATAEHLSTPGSATAVGVDSHNLALKLAERIKGQESAIAKVADRLALTRAQLDLRPERPDGVFLFVGPTGVGKTELAKEVALQEYGAQDRLVRLDMSEYAQEWAISRLVGPMPGFVGSTEPESWLTTKVAAMPECVVLLDEIEKAHPRVWNTFLQVFDAGRLTDSRGVVADFSSTVVILTSNLGVAEVGTQPLGFGDAATANERNRERLMSHIKQHMAPELLNRIDEIVMFDQLPMSAIVEIARYELDEARARLAAAGWLVECDDDVPNWLADTGYDPAYGARHLQRNVEREFLSHLARATTKRVRVSVEDGALTFAPIE